MSKHNTYSPLEERINVYSHVLGIILGVVALVLLLRRDLQNPVPLVIFSNCVFSFSMIFLYWASVTYHNTSDVKKRFRLKVLDHCAIYVLIAGTYTPYALITMVNHGGWSLFSLAWGFAITGIILKLLFTGRFKVLSTLLYVVMGWLIVLFGNSLMQTLPEEGIRLLILGGCFYTTGAVIYLIKKIPLNHGIFHIFVLAGSICHFLSIYWYVGQ